MSLSNLERPAPKAGLSVFNYLYFAAMNWAIYLTTIGLIIAGAGFLHQLLVKRKDATIETLTEKNKWLEEQLEVAKSNSPDILTDRLSKRILILKDELEQLSKDYETNQTAINAKEEELEKAKGLLTELEDEIERHKEQYEDLVSQIDRCPYCEAELVELTYIEAEEDSGSLRSYKCGYSEIDGYVKHLCPSDPDYPRLSDFELVTRFRAASSEWSCAMRGKTLMAQRVPVIITSGRTEEEARQRAIDSYNNRCNR